MEYYAELGTNVPEMSRKIPWTLLPTREIAELWRASMNRSYLPGGHAYHITKDLGYTPYVHVVRILDAAGNLVTMTSAPAYEEGI